MAEIVKEPPRICSCGGEVFNEASGFMGTIQMIKTIYTCVKCDKAVEHYTDYRKGD